MLFTPYVGPPPGRPLLPPGPPPGLPPLRLPTTGPRLIRIPAPPLMSTAQPMPQPKPNVLSAAPQLINRFVLFYFFLDWVK